MPVPPLRDLITPTSTGASLPAQTMNERLLLTLAMLATGKAPDGTTLPTGAAASPPVAGYYAWYDASQITGQSDNTTLASWPDLSGNAYNLIGSGTPTYYSTTSAKLINGKPAVWLNSSSSMLTVATIAAPPTVFIVAGVNSLSDVEGLVESQTGGYSLRVNAGHLDLLKQGTTDMATSTGSVTTAPFMACVTYNGAQVVFYINSGTLDSTVAASAVQNAARLAIADNDPLTGPVAEILLYSTVLTGPQITSTYTYLKTKWGTP